MSVRVQFPRYVSTAALSAGSDWVVFVALGFAGLGPVGAQAISRIVGGVASFVLNKVWTYEARGSTTTSSEMAKFGLLYGLSYVLSLGLLHLLTGGMGVPVAVAKLVADGVCFVVNFAAMKSWVFAPRPGDQAVRSPAADVT